jgi:hypothetical protein
LNLRQSDHGGDGVSLRFNGLINVETRDSTPDWSPYVQPVAPKGPPNVLYIVLDDVGFSAMERE